MMGLTGRGLDAQDERNLLEEALATVRDQGFRMQRAIDAHDESAVLNHAAEMLRELRTSLLSPKNYYHLCTYGSYSFLAYGRSNVHDCGVKCTHSLYPLVDVQVVDQLRHLEHYVLARQQAGASLRELYDRVQSSGNVVPRLYLLVTVGAVSIQSRQARARDVLTDLVDMTRGVQDPLRGLFLRYYLSQSVRDKLPDTGSCVLDDHAHNGGDTVADAIAFLLENLRATNELWIRLHARANVRAHDRTELQVLVGTSLVRLSELDGVTTHVYRTTVLPELLHAIVLRCKDAMAQQYLMDCIVHVFPDEYHLATLEPLLQALETLEPHVDVWLILKALVERLTTFRATQPTSRALLEHDATRGDAVVEKILDASTTRVLATDTSVPCPDKHVVSVVQFVAAFVAFVLAWSTTPETKRHALQRVLATCVVQVVRPGTTGCTEARRTAPDVVTSVHALVLVLVERLELHELVQLPSVLDVVALLPWQSAWKDVALTCLRLVVARHDAIASDQTMAFVLEMVAPVVRATCPHDDAAACVQVSEQHTLAKLVHLVVYDDLDVTFRVLSVARRAFLQSGVARLRFTLVPLIYESLALTRALARDDARQCTTTSPRDVLQFVHEMVTALASKHDAHAVSCVHLLLECARVADACGLDAGASEFLTQAWIVYEDQITGGRDQCRALTSMVASVRTMEHLARATYDGVATKLTQYAARLRETKDQATIVLQCAHLFWHPTLQDGKRVRECLQRSLRLANASASHHVPLFLDILEAYLYFYEMVTPEVTRKYVVGLLTLVKETLENVEYGPTRREGEARYRAIVRYLDALELRGERASECVSLRPNLYN
ncbi:hypothetical protein PsorP6_007307 [Peronosclerospora sorghi]|uniref:Uncharacterized protein n=1 Tax=Peronosclerospora sorghi TaxID=230839 RepID=A0ACC0W8R7_9STRA|nr:hypothetical protein PsorP6_007307 [Peronosclerospora sorghi]